MSKIKVNNIEAASGNTITIPAGFNLDVQGSLQGGGLSNAITEVVNGYVDSGDGAATDPATGQTVFYDFDLVSSPISVVEKSPVSGTIPAEFVTSVAPSLFHSLLLRKKFVGGILNEVTAGCGEFFQFANTGTSASGSRTSPWFNIGLSSSGMSFAINAATAEGNGYASGTTFANTFKFGWFFTTATNGSDQARGLSRWIFDFGTLTWYFVTGATPSSAATNVGGGFYMYSEYLGWHWSRADIYPFFYINSPPNYVAGGSVTGDPVGWSFWNVDTSSDTAFKRTKHLYLYSRGIWVDPCGTGASAPLATANSGISGPATAPSTTPSASVPTNPDVVVTAQ